VQIHDILTNLHQIIGILFINQVIFGHCQAKIISKESLRRLSYNTLIANVYEPCYAAVGCKYGII